MSEIDYDAFKKAFPNEIDDMPHDYDDLRDFCNEVIQAYESAKEPVSLEKCALALCRQDAAWDMHTYTNHNPHVRGIDLTKAVLNAAGVKYVD